MIVGTSVDVPDCPVNPNIRRGRVSCMCVCACMIRTYVCAYLPVFCEV